MTLGAFVTRTGRCFPAFSAVHWVKKPSDRMILINVLGIFTLPPPHHLSSLLALLQRNLSGSFLDQASVFQFEVEELLQGVGTLTVLAVWVVVLTTVGDDSLQVSNEKLLGHVVSVLQSLRHGLQVWGEPTGEKLRYLKSWQTNSSGKVHREIKTSISMNKSGY